MTSAVPQNSGESFETARPVITPREAASAIHDGVRAAGANGTHPAPSVARTPPHSTEAEEAVLSCCIQDDGFTLARAVSASITPASFFSPPNAIVFQTLLQMRDAKIPISVATLHEEIAAAKELGAVGGMEFILHLSGDQPTTAQAGYFIGKVVELATVRDIMRAAALALEDCYAYSGDLPALTDDLTRRLTFAARSGAPATQSNHFELWRPTQFLDYKVDPDACLLGEGFVEMGQWTSFIGIGGLGKTRLALWFVICQILNRPWCGLMTHGKPQKAVFLSTENGIRRWKTDLEKMLPTFTDLERATLDENLRILAMTPDEEGDMCLGNSETVLRLTATLIAEKPGIVIFDPFADMVDGDENKAMDLVKTLRTLRQITRGACPTAAVIIIHHARTGAGNVAQAGDNFNAGNFGRGSKTLYSRVRCEIQLAPKDRDDSNTFVMACGKANDCPKFETRCVVFDPETFTYSIDSNFDVDAWRDDVAGKRKQSSASIEEVVRFIRQKCPIAGDQIDMKSIYSEFEPDGINERSIQRTVKAAIEAGYLRKGDKRGTLRLGAKPLK